MGLSSDGIAVQSARPAVNAGEIGTLDHSSQCSFCRPSYARRTSFFLLQTFFFAGVLPRFVLFATTAPLSPPPQKKITKKSPIDSLESNPLRINLPSVRSLEKVDLRMGRDPKWVVTPNGS